ncbi:MAG: NAD(P)-binding domain-containing protein [Pseudonocardiaceae bacterium]
MKIGIIGPGRMGSGLGRRWVGAGHEVMFSFSRDQEQLERLAGFEPVDAGPLKNARYIEPMGMLFLQLAYGQQMGTSIATKLLRPVSA